MSAVLSAFFVSPTVQTALVVGTVVAVVSGIVGVFTITRGQSFAGHALADLGAVGGSGAFLLGVSQLWGFVLAGVVSAVAMEAIGTRRLEGRDVATGVVFGAGMGLTALFLTLDTLIGGSSNAAISVLFGSLFSVDSRLVPVIVALGAATLAIVAAVWRWVSLETLDRDLAAARGVPTRWASTLFLIALALSVQLSSLSIGAILSTALLIGPAATALLFTRRLGTAAALAAVIAVGQVGVGCLVSFASYDWFGGNSWPVSFTIVAAVFLTYMGARAVDALRPLINRTAVA
ncbi:zinc/manganese transport system permease protein [Microbacterium testaceum]|uniref:metal ABC transporter permease n=1 Tax=Microbacterium TaxID=33882 RepID=UPI001AE2CF2D|nr:MULTISPECIES: metal ABC transporter permease [Microbacterium]MDQ1113603.1 zinc/manganese transport system permease protein [Microbacterium testaceum]MDR6099296.1 zinc/manganese transport system permease protein [Microbacterium sp. SORGH_AS_0454]